MSPRPYIVADQMDRDAIALRWVVERQLPVILECRNCRRVRALDPLEMIARFGSPSATLGMNPRESGLRTLPASTAICLDPRAGRAR